MKSIFIIYIPLTNYDALVHYEDTIKNKVPPGRIYRYVNNDLRNELRDIFVNRPITVWGSSDNRQNRFKYNRMKRADDILIVVDKTIKLLGKIAVKTINPELSKELWKNIRGDSIASWDLIYFIANPLEIDLPFNEIIKLFNYKSDFQLRGLFSPSEDKLIEFYNRYDDLYSVLQRIKSGERIEEVKAEYLQDAGSGPEIQDEDLDELLGKKDISEHLKIQWKLICLGKKVGTKVWIPKNDQSRIIKEYDFDQFESEFSAGIDIPAKYVENIDVVWKEEFRIDAAFEIEHSTTIYSGLLRFSDLKIIAPNSNYPLFIVAPNGKRNRITEQVKRPTFRKIDFDKKVRFLSYEAVEEIDGFFKDSTSGLNVELIIGKSEIIK